MKFNKKSFTLIELILVIAIITVLSSFVFIDVFRSKGGTELIMTIDVLVSDLKNQQLKAMTGNTQGQGSNDSYGIYFQTDKYILFQGPNYNTNESNNFEVALNSGDRFSQINLSDSQIVFASGSGEIAFFDPGQEYSLVLTNTNKNLQKTIIFNKLGVITNIN